MNLHFSYVNEMQTGAKRPCDAIALSEDRSRAAGIEEID
jgi:hypothetical protein